MTLPVFTSSAPGTMSTARQRPDGIRTASPGTSPWARKVIIALSVCGAMPYWRLPTSFCGGEYSSDMGRGGGWEKRAEKSRGSLSDTAHNRRELPARPFVLPRGFLHGFFEPGQVFRPLFVG